MNILFDLIATQPMANAKFHGGGLYGEIVFFALSKRVRHLTAIYNGKLYINPKILESGIKLYDINHISLKEIAKNENIDVFYKPVLSCSSYELPNALFKRCAITFHDVRDLEILYDRIESYYVPKSIKKIIKKIAKFFIKDYLERRLRKKIKRLYDKSAYLKDTEFITDSEHSKHNIINFYPHLALKDIPVFYPPLNDEQFELPLPKFEQKSYFLLTNSARWEKNNLRAVWAFDELFSQRKDLTFKVVLTGVTNEKIYTKKMKNKDRFIFLGYVDRPELLSLYKNAYAFIFPSLNEGFGYPPIESMRYGVPVAASGTTSIPEICQNAAIYFDPYNVSEIKNRILQLLDKNIHAEYSARAVERYKIVSEKQKADLEKIVDFILGGNNA